MAMILDAFMSKCCTLLTDFVHEEFILVLGVKDELQKLLRTMKHIQCLLKDAEKRKIDESSIDLWLSDLKDVMYDAEDIIDLCKIKLVDERPKNKSSQVCFNFSSARFSSCFTRVPLRHEIGTRIKEVNDRLDLIYQERQQFKLERSEILETPQITRVNLRQTDSIPDRLIVGGEVEAATNELVNILIGEKSEKKCHLVAVTGMGGIGKTTLAQKVFNHPKMQTYFTLKSWVCISQTYSEIELLKQIIRGAKRSYGDANTKAELQGILRDSFASDQNSLLVLDDVWRADVWVDLLRTSLHNTNTSVLVTTRYERVAKAMKTAYTHNVMTLSIESSWDMLCKLLFSDGQENPANELQDLGINILKRCGGLPLAIKVIAGVLIQREFNRIEWQKVLMSDVWSIRDLHEDHIAALHLSFEDLPSHLKQCFLYLSLFGEDEDFHRDYIVRLWVAEGFITEDSQSLLTEDIAGNYFDELLGRNLLLLNSSLYFRKIKMHDIVRSLAIFLSKEEISHGDVNGSTFTKLRRLAIKDEKAKEATNIFDLVAKQRALRTLLVSESNLLLDDERMRLLFCLRVLDISVTDILQLPDSIGDLIHLRYFNLSYTKIMAIPKTIKRLACLQFLDISFCKKLTQLPNEILQLHNLRYLDM